jgi:CTP-dependent riboflavin kinase
MKAAMYSRYPADLLEVLCEVHLREAPGLHDGDRLTLTLPDPR